MKQRRVFVTLEIESSVPVGVLRDSTNWNAIWDLARVDKWGCFKCLQAQANVAKPARKKKRVK